MKKDNEITLIRTTAEDPQFVALVRLLDADLAILDGDDHDFYNQYNGLDQIKHVVLALHGEQAVACGSIKPFEDPDLHTAVEVKRMYTNENVRGRGLATSVLHELEKWASEMGYKRSLLETGKRMPDAIGLYKKCGYKIIPNYGQYRDVENSVCFEKPIK